jgi:hypothetical protein
LAILFKRALREAGSDSTLALGRVTLTDNARMNCVDIEASFENDSGAREFRARESVSYAAWMQSRSPDIGRCEQLYYSAEALWSRMYEDHYVRRVTEAARSNVLRNARSHEDVDRGLHALDAWEQHARNFHQARDAAYRIDRDLLGIESRHQTATEVEARAREAAARIAASIDAEIMSVINPSDVGPSLTLADLQRARAALHANPFAADWRRAFHQYRYATLADYYGLDVGIDVGTAEANERGMKLLRENLTPAQLKQYERERHFDVKGGDTGATYRIHHGRQMNIRQLGKGGKVECGWCFLPQGGLVAGDVMLAQKTALELYETEALKIANRFAA